MIKQLRHHGREKVLTFLEIPLYDYKCKRCEQFAARDAQERNP